MQLEQISELNGRVGTSKPAKHHHFGMPVEILLPALAASQITSSSNSSHLSNIHELNTIYSTYIAKLAAWNAMIDGDAGENFAWESVSELEQNLIAYPSVDFNTTVRKAVLVLNTPSLFEEVSQTPDSLRDFLRSISMERNTQNAS